MKSVKTLIEGVDDVIAYQEGRKKLKVKSVSIPEIDVSAIRKQLNLLRKTSRRNSVSQYRPCVIGSKELVSQMVLRVFFSALLQTIRKRSPRNSKSCIWVEISLRPTENYQV